MRVVEDGQLSDFGVVAAEEDGDCILLREDESEVFSGFPEGFHIAEESQDEPGESQGEQAPHWPGRQLGEEECSAELIGQQQA